MQPRLLRPLALCASLCALLVLPACAVLGGPGSDGSGGVPDLEAALRQEFVADMMLSAGRPALASEGYARALLARPADPGLRMKQGRVFLRLNRAEDALAAFRAALAVNADLGEAHHGAGQAALRLGRNAEAREAFSRAVALAPESWRSRCQLGVLLMNEGKAELAREQFLAALALPGTGFPAGAGRDELLNNLGVSQVLAGDLEAAVGTFSLALREARDPERSANNLGLLLARLGRQAEALNAFRAGGNDARALNNLGYALLLQGDAQKALGLFEKALDLSPRYYEAAGENLKLALQGASRRPAPVRGAERGRDAGPEAARNGEGGRDASGPVETVQDARPGVARISLSAGAGSPPRFGPASLVDGGLRRWTF